MSSKRITRTCQRGIHAALFLILLALTSHSSAQPNPLVQGVDAIGITVSDMDRAVDFYSKVLTFEKVSDTEVAGENYEHLEGVVRLANAGGKNAARRRVEFVAPPSRHCGGSVLCSHSRGPACPESWQSAAVNAPFYDFCNLIDPSPV